MHFGRLAGPGVHFGVQNHERHSAKDARAHSLRVALVTIERVCARAQQLRIDRSSRLVKVFEFRKQRTSRRSP
jgi:hypothetical protein